LELIPSEWNQLSSFAGAAPHFFGEADPVRRKML
jgi:hypothetical protein